MFLIQESSILSPKIFGLLNPEKTEAVHSFAKVVKHPPLEKA